MPLPYRVLLLIGVILALNCRARGDSSPEAPLRMDAYGDPLPAGALARMGTIRFRHGGGIRGLAFSPDGKLLASVGGNPLLRLWDFATGKEVRQIRGGAPSFLAAAFSSDGKKLAAVDSDGVLRFWETATGRERNEGALFGGLRSLHSLTFSPDGKFIAFRFTLTETFKSAGIAVLSTTTGKELLRLSEEDYRDGDLIFTPDSKTLVTGASDDWVRLWDVRTWKESRCFRAGGEGVTRLAVSADGKTLVAGCRDGCVRRLDLQEGKTVVLFQVDRPAEWLALSPDGKVLAWVEFNSSVVVLWDTAAGKRLHRLIGNRGPVEAMAFSPDGRILASGDVYEGTIRLWDSATGKRVRRPEAPDWVGQVCYSPNGKLLASVGEGVAGVQLWDPATGKEVARMAGDAGPLLRVCFSPDGKLLATGDVRGGVRLWTVPGGKELRRTRKELGGPVSSLVFSPIGEILAAAAGPRSPRPHLWEAATGKPIRNSSGRVIAPRVWDEYPPGSPARDDWATQVAFAPDGRTVATLNRGTIAIREVATGKVRCSCERNLADIKAIAFAPDGKTLASGEWSGGIVRLWDVYTGKERLPIEVYAENADTGAGRGFHPVSIVALAFSPDGKLLATAGDEEAVRLWDVRTGEERHRFVGHQGPGIHGLAFSPDGKTLVSVGRDTTMLVWDVATALPNKGDREWEDLWVDLAGEDAKRAHRAIGRFVDVPYRAVALLGKRLRPVPAVDAQIVARWVRELDDDSFAEREKATASLEARGEAALPALEQALRGNPSLEARLRIDRLFQRLRSPAAAAERLRTLRALEALERIGSREAEAVLQRLADGAPEAWLTREAKASLHRVQKLREGMP